MTSCIPLRKRLSNRACPIYPLSAHNFPLMFSMYLPCLNDSRLWTWNWGFPPCHWLSDAAWIRRTIPWNIFHARQDLQMSYESESFGYDIHVKEWGRRSWFRYSSPAGLSWWKCSGEAVLPFQVRQNGYKTPDVEKGVSDDRHTPCNNVWSSGNHRNERG